MVGTFTVQIGVGDPARQDFRPIDALVDTGSTFSWVPRSILTSLGHRPRFRVPLVTAEERRIEVDATDEVPIRINDAVRAVICVFGDDEGLPLLGATTLEAHLLAVDPVNQRLIPVDGLAK